MIQRLQSVYLLLAAALVITSMFMPMATIVTPEDPMVLSAMGAYTPGFVCLVGLYKYFPEAYPTVPYAGRQFYCFVAYSF